MHRHHTLDGDGRRSWLYFHLPTNPICWLRGHSPRAVVTHWKFMDPSLWIDCRVCGLRNNDPFDTGKLEVEPGRSWRETADALTARRLEVLERVGERQFLSSVNRRAGWEVRQVTLHQQLVFPGRGRAASYTRRRVGFQLHLGNASSETPIDAHVNAGPLGAVYWTVGGIGGRFAELVGRGHKRDLALHFDAGTDGGSPQLEWKLWHDNDGGSDETAHRCDPWRRPKVWPWSAGRRKARQWMCLREGHLPLNPATAFWGSPLYHYEDVDSAQVVVPVGEFPGDTYLADLKLQRQLRHRDHGPAWARKVQERWSVAWEVEGEGIPYRNHDWKGDGMSASAESLPEDFVRVEGDRSWATLAVLSLVERTKGLRRRYRYRAPSRT